MPGAGVAVGAGLGAVTAYVLDPDRGRGRRAETADRLAELVRRAGRRAGRGYWYIRGTAEPADEFERITAATMAIDGVLTVRNLMRTPSDAPAA